jgi:hypothetical protein
MGLATLVGSTFDTAFDLLRMSPARRTTQDSSMPSCGRLLTHPCRSTPALFGRQGDESQGRPQYVAHRGTPDAAKIQCRRPSQPSLRLEEARHVLGPSWGPIEALDRLWWPQRAISRHIRASSGLVKKIWRWLQHR